MSDTRSLFTDQPFHDAFILSGDVRSANRAAFARLHERADHEADQAADDRAEQGDDEKLAPDSAAQVTDRKEAQRDDEGFKTGGQDGANRPRDNPDENVAYPQIHC